MSTTFEETATSPASAPGEPTMLEQLRRVEETACRLRAARDEAVSDRAAAIERAELAESYGVAVDNALRARDADIRDLTRRLAEAQAALRAATAPVEPPVESETPVPLPQLPEAPQRPVRRPPWRRRPRRRH